MHNFADDKTQSAWGETVRIVNRHIRIGNKY